MNIKPPKSPELQLTVKHRLTARQSSTDAKSSFGNKASSLCAELDASYAALANQFNAIEQDMTRTEAERAYLQSALADKWMKLHAPRVDKMQAELADWTNRCEIALEGTLSESDAAQVTSNGEIRSFLRSFDEGRRNTMAQANPKFAAAVAAQPAELSGVRPEVHELCVEATKQRRLPERYADLQDYKTMSAAVADVGAAMLRNVRDMMAPALMAKRYDPSGPAA